MSEDHPTDINEIPTEVIETDLLIVGGGNAGCFVAIEAKKLNPDLKVTIMVGRLTYPAGHVLLHHRLRTFFRYVGIHHKAVCCSECSPRHRYRRICHDHRMAVPRIVCYHSAIGVYLPDDFYIIGIQCGNSGRMCSYR